MRYQSYHQRDHLSMFGLPSLLLLVVEMVGQHINEKGAICTEEPHCMREIDFVKAGEKRKTKKKKPFATVINRADDWIMISDLHEEYQFPGHILLTPLRPDICLYSDKLKHVFLLELTCPIEERIEESNIIKTKKYSKLCSDIKANGWKPDLYCFEVGSRGHVGNTYNTMCHMLGIPAPKRKETLKKISKIAIKSSYSIYLQRKANDFKKWDFKI